MIVIYLPSPEHQETFWTLLRDPAHWGFEIFLMIVFDGIVGALLWPFVRKHWRHHVSHDKLHGSINKAG